MIPRELARLVRLDLRRGRRTFAVSVAGIAVGVAALAFFLALSAGVRRGVLGRIFPVGLVEVVPARVSSGGVTALLQLGGARPLTDEVAATLRSRPEVAAAYARMRIAFPARAWGGHELFGHDLHAELVAEGVSPEALAGEALGPEPFGDGQGSQRACAVDAECASGEYCPWDTRRCEPPIPAVISPVLLEIYNGSIAPSHGLPKIGGFLASRFRGFTFTVELGRSFMGMTSPGREPHQRRVMLVGVSPHASPLALTLPLGAVRRWNEEYAGVASARELSSVLLELRPGAGATGLVAAVRALGFEVADTGAEKAALAITLVTLLLTLVSCAIVVLSGINITHGLYRTVTERRREIGLLRALGATAADVRRLFLGEALAVGAAGALSGLALARIGAWGLDRAAVRWVPDFPFKPETFFSFDPVIVAVAVGCSLGACLLGALGPARAAARLEPTEALAGS